MSKCNAAHCICGEKMNKKQMEAAGKSREEVLEAALDAAFEIIESLPVDPCDMDVHFWCTRHEDEDEEE